MLDFSLTSPLPISLTYPSLVLYKVLTSCSYLLTDTFTFVAFPGDLHGIRIKSESSKPSTTDFNASKVVDFIKDTSDHVSTLPLPLLSTANFRYHL